jgi:hypothetical protein
VPVHIPNAYQDREWTGWQWNWATGHHYSALSDAHLYTVVADAQAFGKAKG